MSKGDKGMAVYGRLYYRGENPKWSGLKIALISGTAGFIIGIGFMQQLI